MNLNEFLDWIVEIEKAEIEAFKVNDIDTVVAKKEEKKELVEKARAAVAKSEEDKDNEDKKENEEKDVEKKEALSEEVLKKLHEISGRLEVVEKSEKESKQLDKTGAKVEKSVWADFWHQ